MNAWRDIFKRKPNQKAIEPMPIDKLDHGMSREAIQSDGVVPIIPEMLVHPLRSRESILADMQTRDKAAYWAKRNAPKEKKKAELNILVCANCMKFDDLRKNANRGPFIKVPGGMAHENCPAASRT